VLEEMLRIDLDDRVVWKWQRFPQVELEIAAVGHVDIDPSLIALRPEPGSQVQSNRECCIGDHRPRLPHRGAMATAYVNLVAKLASCSPYTVRHPSLDQIC
jgi:hypothetical protein